MVGKAKPTPKREIIPGRIKGQLKPGAKTAKREAAKARQEAKSAKPTKPHYEDTSTNVLVPEIVETKQDCLDNGAEKKVESRRGRLPGVPNRITSEAREAFTRLIEANANKLQSWLEQVAHKDAERAYRLFLETAEFAVPKLSRTEITGSNDPDSAPLALHFVLHRPNSEG